MTATQPLTSDELEPCTGGPCHQVTSSITKNLSRGVRNNVGRMRTRHDNESTDEIINDCDNDTCDDDDDDDNDNAS